MPILKPGDEEAVRRRFELELKSDVKLTLFTQLSIGGLYIPGRECRSCESTQKLLEEVSSLSPRIQLDIVDYYGSQEDASAQGIDRVPALIVNSNGNNNARFYGMPSGFEFALLLDSIVEASSARSTLQTETRRRLKALEHDVPPPGLRDTDVPVLSFGWASGPRHGHGIPPDSRRRSRGAGVPVPGQDLQRHERPPDGH